MARLSPHRVLLVEDSQDDADLIVRRLGDGFAVSHADNAGEVEAALTIGGWDLVLSDWNVPGLDTPAMLRSLPERLPDTPHILLTGSVPFAELVSAMQLGARDCFDKDQLAGLRGAALREITSAKASTEARRREQELVQQNQALLAETVAQGKLFEALHKVALAASGELKVKPLIDLMVESGKSLLGGVCGALTLWDEAANCLRVVSQSADGLQEATALPVSSGANGLAFTDRQPVIVNDYANWPHRLALMVELGCRSILTVPMVVSGQPIGTLGFFTLEPHEFTTHDTEVARMLAAQLAPAIDAARAHEDLTRRAAKQALVAQIGRAAASRTEEDELAVMAVDGLAQLLNAESAAVLEASGNGLRVAHATGWLKAVDAAVGSPDDLGPAGSPVATDRIQRSLARPEATTCAGLNVEHAGEAAMLLVCRVQGAGFGDADLHFLAAIGSILTEASRAAAAERALRESDERFRMLFESSLEGVWYVDADGRTIYSNRRMAEILHTDVAALQQQSVWDFTDRAGWPALRKRFAAVLGGVSSRFEGQYLAADGTTVWTSVGSSPTRDRDGTITGLVALVTDLSDRKAAERAHRESEVKSRFLARMSHELRTPLNSVLGFAQLLESPSFDPLTDRQRRYIGHITNQGQHLLELINDVLDLSRVAAGQLPMAQERVDLASTVADVVVRLGPLAQAKHQEVRVEVEKGAVVSADRLRVAQAVMNLLSNAVKFTPDGGEIGVTVARRGASYAVVVTDDGPGIAPDDQLIAFDEFSKLSAGRRGEGTGLGLSLTRRLVEAMGGVVSLQSEVTKGATFTIELPAA